MFYQSNKAWQEHEKYQLWLAYQVKTPLKVLEIYFNRSSSAINKFLSRSGIRKIVKTASSEKDHQVKIKSLKELELLFLGIGIDTKTIQLERNFGLQWSPNSKVKSCLLKFGIKGNPPWEVKSIKHKFPVSLLSLKKDNSYVSIETCCHYLIRHGVSVKNLSGRTRFNWTHLINNQPTTSMGLLRETNKLRIKNKEPIFHVKNLTVD